MPRRKIFRCGHSSWCFIKVNDSSMSPYYTTLELDIYGLLQINKKVFTILPAYHTRGYYHSTFCHTLYRTYTPHQNHHGSELGYHHRYRHIHTNKILPRPYLVTDNVLIRVRYVVDLICSCCVYIDNSWFQVEVR